MTNTPLPLQQWATRWQLPAACMADLLQVMGVGASSPPDTPTSSRTKEGYAQSLVRLDGARHGVNLFRNNVGVLMDKTERPVRYGLANDSKQVNETFKSGDLIGIRPVQVTPAHVGTVIGQFVSRECKAPGWRWRGDAHEQAQMNWATLINSMGGDARFASGEGSFG